jgi:hypothetical protein
MAKGLSEKGYRVASIAMGDDTTRARFVRVDQGEHGRKRRLNKPRLPGFEAAFIQEGRTKFSKAVQAPNDHILVSGHNNIKIGRDVRKGPLRGYWIYTLSLEERKTCPSTCSHWQTCYGNNMPFAKRVDHTHPNFYADLARAVARVCRLAKRRGSGALIRLHALGDFFSTDYVNFWNIQLTLHPNLALYGYTARLSGTTIGWMVHEMNVAFGARCMIRFSNDPRMPLMSTRSIGRADSAPAGVIVCPEQTGRVLGCDYCGLCWGTRKNIAFIEH